MYIVLDFFCIAILIKKIVASTMCSIVHFNSFTSKKSLFTTINRLKIFIYYFACVLIAEIIGYCVSGSVHILINARAVTEKLHSVDSCLLLVEYQKQIEQKN